MISVREGEVRKAFELSQMITEFTVPFTQDSWQDQFSTRHAVCYTAYMGKRLSGLLAGVYDNSVFRVVVIGVLPEHRRMGVAKVLMVHAIDGAIQREALKIEVVANNRFRAMLIFALYEGFDIVAAEPARDSDHRNDMRIVLEKKL